MTTRPATAPEQNPTTVALPFRMYSTVGHTNEAIAVASVVVVNALADEGMASSIRAGVARARELGVAGVVLMACDQVALRAEHLRALSGDVGRVTGSGYAGKVGIPAYFPAENFGELMELQGDVGARELLRGAVAVVDEGLGLDVDTEADVERARGLIG